MQSQVEDTILACPVCGRTPAVSLKGIAGHGCWATIKCKPIFGRSHLKVVRERDKSIQVEETANKARSEITLRIMA